MHLPTRREVQVFAPGLALSAPFPTAEGIYFNCSRLRPDRFSGVYRIPLPAAPNGS